MSENASVLVGSLYGLTLDNTKTLYSADMPGFTPLLADPAAFFLLFHALLTFYYPLIYGFLAFTALYWCFPLGIALIVRK